MSLAAVHTQALLLATLAIRWPKSSAGENAKMNPQITRRSLIGGAAAGAATAVIPFAASAEAAGAAAPHAQADVIVVGAGLAGLVAARQLVAAGRSVLVLEARDRVGGRTLNAQLPDGQPIEIGGQWAGPTQDHVLALAKELGIGTYPTYNTGDNLYYRKGKLQRFSSSGPFGPVPPETPGQVEAEKVIIQLDQMASQVPLDEPWTAARAAEYDGQTFETFKLANTTTEGGRFLFDLGIEAVFGAEPRDLSLLFVLAYIRGGGNEQHTGTFERLVDTAGGAQEQRFVGGSQLISLKMAEALGNRIVLSSPVRRITQDGNGVVVESDQVTASGAQVVVAMSPALTAPIDFQPRLPSLRNQLVQRTPLGSVIKCEAVYSKPFWRDQGLTGQVLSDVSPVRVTFDNTPNTGSPGVMLGFIEGENARRYSEMPPDQRRNAVIANFTAFFGPQAANPIAFIEKDWLDEEYSRGCYAAFTPPGVLLDYGPAIRDRVGRVHWAGTETATLWNGYMDGAVRSGERVAAEVLGALGNAPSVAPAGAAAAPAAHAAETLEVHFYGRRKRLRGGLLVLMRVSSGHPLTNLTVEFRHGHRALARTHVRRLTSSRRRVVLRHHQGYVPDGHYTLMVKHGTGVIYHRRIHLH